MNPLSRQLFFLAALSMAGSPVALGNPQWMLNDKKFEGMAKEARKVGDKGTNELPTCPSTPPGEKRSDFCRTWDEAQRLKAERSLPPCGPQCLQNLE